MLITFFSIKIFTPKIEPVQKSMDLSPKCHLVKCFVAAQNPHHKINRLSIKPLYTAPCFQIFIIKTFALFINVQKSIKQHNSIVLCCSIIGAVLNIFDVCYASNIAGMGSIHTSLPKFRPPISTSKFSSPTLKIPKITQKYFGNSLDQQSINTAFLPF